MRIAGVFYRLHLLPLTLSSPISKVDKNPYQKQDGVHLILSEIFILRIKIIN